MDSILLTSGFIDPALAAARRRWQVIDIECQREALAWLRGVDALPSAICIGRAVDIGDDLDAWQMLKSVRAAAPGVPVLISTSEHSPQVIVELVKAGAFDYVLEPADRGDPSDVARYTQELVFSLARAVEWRLVLLENQRLKADLVREQFPEFVVGRSRAMAAVMDLTRKVSPTSATVLISGESGTGKELIARSIHSLSSHRQGPFVALNCGSFSENLIASELFGHERGAFTGADSARRGLIREAEGGTLFLDEIATIPPGFQVMLLRVLEQRLARPVGGNGDYAVNCRFIAAANRDLESMVRQGLFREDLFYRLNVFNIHLPPLRSRREDIPLLANVFMHEAAREYGRRVNALSPGALAMLESAAWPGNVRQLRNAIERAVIVCDGDTLDSGDLDNRVRGIGASSPQLTVASDYEQAMRTFEHGLIRAALERTQGNRSEAARLLQMKRGRLNYRIRHLGLDQ